MIHKAYDKWCDELLDIGKRNTLINFKEQKQRTIEVFLPKIETIFHDLVDEDKQLTIFDVDSHIKKEQAKLVSTQNTILQKQERTNATLQKEEESASSLSQSSNTLSIAKNEKEDSIEAIESVFSVEKMIKQVAPLLKGNQIFVYRPNTNTQKTLASIAKLAKTHLQEKGVNILYITFGFLHWKESENSSIIYKAPLLLVPIKLECNNNKTTIAAYEDEVITNPILIQKLKIEFNLTLPTFQEENFEAEGLFQYFSRVQACVQSQNWTVEPSMHIATFTFFKLNMYHDLKENRDTILSHPVILKLLNDPQANSKPFQSVDMDDYFKQGKEFYLHNVVDADSSQVEAIIQAKEGNSFVLQGPPGTGKSQTITNIIAECLHDGKKILFVSEKLAALNVVYNNLAKVGLADFCLELHSEKANKKEVLTELTRVLQKDKKTMNSNAVEQELKTLRDIKEQLDAYVHQLHTVHDKLQLTPYQVLSYMHKERNLPQLDFVIENITEKSREDLRVAVGSIQEFSSYQKEMGVDFRKQPWYGLKTQNLRYEDKLTFKNQLKSLIEQLPTLLAILSEIEQELKLIAPTVQEYKNLLVFVGTFANLTIVESCLFDRETLTFLLSEITAFTTLQTEIETQKTALAAQVTESFYNLPIKEYQQEFSTRYNSVFRVFNGGYKQAVKSLQACLVGGQKLKHKQMIELLTLGVKVIELQEKMQQHTQKITEYFTDKHIFDKSYDWQKILKELQTLQQCMPQDVLYLKHLDREHLERAKLTAKRIANKLQTLFAKENILDKCLQYFDESIKTLSMQACQQKFINCYNAFDSLEKWLQFTKVLQQLEQQQLLPFIHFALDEKVAVENLASCYKQAFYKQWFYAILAQNSILNDLPRHKHDALIANFKEKDKLKLQIARAEILAKLSKEVPTVYGDSGTGQVANILREANKKRNQKPLRQLFAENALLVQRIKPCFLMSPLSISTYLGHNSCTFDVVIFDEASQIFPWDAVGAIARAKQLIVVGDSKQMPPSDFFGSSGQDVDDDDDKDDVLDFESILDICSAALPQNRLSWHYRSKTEELIQFSNKNFYDSSLTSFPSAHKDMEDMGIDFYHVPDGIFDRTSKRNLIEAEKVVDLIYEHFQKQPTRSLGVVAFSKSQQDAIEDALQRRRKKDDSLASCFEADKKSAFFIKNLETVQGDERDTILFSIGYAKDNTGRFLHNFGPLNRKGGERRLNVAVTRAKYNIKVVSSIRQYDIDLSKTAAEGARLLKEYLDIAENGLQNLAKQIAVTGLEADSYFELEVYEILKEAGYKVDKQVGCGGYRIDLAVKHPERAEYVLAIECDGATYHSSRTARDRDRLRQEVLEGLGWKFYRIWSTDWFKNNKEECEKLKQAVESAIVAFDQKLTSTTQVAQEQSLEDAQTLQAENFLQEKTEAEIEMLFPKYVHYDIQAKDLKNITKAIHSILAVEQPITEAYLLEKCKVLFDRKRVTEAYKVEFMETLQTVNAIYKDIHKIEDYYTLNARLPINLRIVGEEEAERNIATVPFAELASGMQTLITHSIGISKQELYKLFGKLLKNKTLKAEDTTQLDKALQSLLRANIIKEVDGALYIL